MSLDLEKLHKLRDKGFLQLYDGNQQKWEEMVQNARGYAQTFAGGDDRIRPGDIVGVIINAIRIDRDFENHMKRNHLTQKYWTNHFADYILDRAYPPPEI